MIKLKDNGFSNFYKQKKKFIKKKFNFNFYKLKLIEFINKEEFKRRLQKFYYFNFRVLEKNKKRGNKKYQSYKEFYKTKNYSHHEREKIKKIYFKAHKKELKKKGKVLMKFPYSFLLDQIPQYSQRDVPYHYFRSKYDNFFYKFKFNIWCKEFIYRVEENLNHSRKKMGNLFYYKEVQYNYFFFLNFLRTKTYFDYFINFYKHTICNFQNYELDSYHFSYLFNFFFSFVLRSKGVNYSLFFHTTHGIFIFGY